MNLCRTSLAIACVLVCLNACTKTPDAQAPAPASADDNAVSSFAGVTLDMEAQQRLGLEFAPVTSTLANAVARGTAVVIDGAALAATQADLESARAEVAAARENLDRLQKLYADDGNASRQAVDAARTQWAAARARLATAEAKLRSDWGAQIVGAPGAGGKLLGDIASGRALLLRAEFAGVLPADVGQLQYSLLSPDPSDNASLGVEFVGRSHAPAQVAGGPSVLLRIAPSNRDYGLRPGERLSVIAASRSVSARPVVPAGAAFADGGRFWCYVAREGGRFDRVPLLSTERVADGYPVTSGAKEGDRVVVRGAPLLLSLERGAGSVADEG
jgi:hypothetical protein